MFDSHYSAYSRTSTERKTFAGDLMPCQKDWAGAAPDFNCDGGWTSQWAQTLPLGSTTFSSDWHPVQLLLLVAQDLVTVGALMLHKSRAHSFVVTAETTQGSSGFLLGGSLPLPSSRPTASLHAVSGFTLSACRALIYSAFLKIQHSPSPFINSVWQWWNWHSYSSSTRWYLCDHLRWGKPQTHECEDHVQGKSRLGKVNVTFPERMATQGKKGRAGTAIHHHSGKTVKASGDQRCAPTQVQTRCLNVLLKFSHSWRSWAPCTVPTGDTKPCQSSKWCQSQLVPQPWWYFALWSQSFSSASADVWANSKSRYFYESSAKHSSMEVGLCGLQHDGFCASLLCVLSTLPTLT